MGKHRERPVRQAAAPIVESAEIILPGNFSLPKLSELPVDHHAVTYAAGRKLPAKYFGDLYYAEKFKKWANSVVPDAMRTLDFDHPRIVIPFRNKQGRIFAFQGRALEQKDQIKYLTVKIDPDAQKIYGLNRINYNKTVYVVEGPFDSMFLDNAIGTADSSLTSAAGLFNDVVLVWDNEPRSEIIVRKIEQAITDGYSVVVWKKSNTFKDINEAVTDFGFDEKKINDLIKERTYHGLGAFVELYNWSKV